MRPKRIPLQAHFILPLGFGWNKDKGYPGVSGDTNVSEKNPGTEGALLFEQIKML